MLRSIEIKPWFLRFVLYEHFSSSLSLAQSLWVTEVNEPHNRPLLCWGTEVQYRKLCWVTEVQYEKYAGSRKCSTKNMLGHGSAVRKICWVTEVQYEKYAGARKCSTKNMLGHGSAVRKICWVTEDHRDSPGAPLLSRQVPLAFWGAVLFRAPV